MGFREAERTSNIPYGGKPKKMEFTGWIVSCTYNADKLTFTTNPGINRPAASNSESPRC